MAFITSTQADAPRSGSFLAAIRRGFSSYIDGLSRADELQRLTRMSDRELSNIGVERSDIVRYVFRDRIGF
ncbi:DUF1127 domain-containing protein [Roseisalinus antarcticus]|uniref:DUF1127 domain-containing protein n=1 Tax=Roseisalinus antarcticus TaxID=254357 RepID=A0A1Y5SZL0_9RHOB|nr:DUF1127 domain-containing protein [Roseisalinus antarcticus]SLN51981.1 hypothetical protein ROA7023_02286 [Roseisalinus antarcticus]